MPLKVAALIVGGGSKSIALSALTSPPLFSVTKIRFIFKSFIFKIICVYWDTVSVSVIVKQSPDIVGGEYQDKGTFFCTIEGLRCA